MKDAAGKYVVAFNRDRDFYHVPWALAEHGLLDCLITDLYVPDFLATNRFVSRLGIAHRRCQGLSSRLVKTSCYLIVSQLLMRKRAQTAAQQTKLFLKLDAYLSRLALRRSRKTHANLFLYSGYAYEAFRENQGSQIQKILFVYHPQGDRVQAILAADYRLNPEVVSSHRLHMQAIELREGSRFREEIKMADMVVCASSFARESVRQVLGPGSSTPIHVVPYGCSECPDETGADGKSPGVTRFLFVGQGTQRKGLHHLIKAWARLSPALEAELTLVVNNLDPGILDLVKQLPKPPRMLSRLSNQELQGEFARADVYIMPSLVEGFGLVYLEAFAAGCYVVGSQNSGLPDLNPPEECCTIVPAGDISVIEKAIQKCVARKAAGLLSPEAIKSFARTRTWVGFREGIRRCVE